MAEAAPALKRELGFRDVTLFAMACVTSARWIAPAGHNGPGSVVLWLLTGLLFMLPLSIAVSTLVERYPYAGGLYVWARGDFGPWHGFLCFWTYWMGIAVWFPSAAIFYMSIGLHTLGPSAGRLGGNRLCLLAIAVAAIWIALGSNVVGINIGKWTENFGGLATWLLCLVLVTMAALVWARRGPATPMHFLPKFDWTTVNFWSYIAYGMSGFELVGCMAGEIRNPKGTVRRVGWMAPGFATAFYVASTVALLAVLSPQKITELNGLVESGQEAGMLLGAAWLTPLIAFLVLVSGLGIMGGIGAGTSRLPFAAGVDHLLPKIFARVHPRWGTPHYSILLLGAVGTVLLCAYQLGDTMRAAYQEMVSLTVIVGFLPYLYIFGSAWKAGKRLSALSGWSITLMAIVCSLVPTDEIDNVWLFEGKLAAGTIAIIGSAWLVYRRRGHIIKVL